MSAPVGCPRQSTHVSISGSNTYFPPSQGEIRHVSHLADELRLDPIDAVEAPGAFLLLETRNPPAE